VTDWINDSVCHTSTVLVTEFPSIKELPCLWQRFVCEWRHNRGLGAYQVYLCNTNGVTDCGTWATLCSHGYYRAGFVFHKVCYAYRVFMVTTKLGLCVTSKPGFRASNSSVRGQEVAQWVTKKKYGAETYSVLIRNTLLQGIFRICWSGPQKTSFSTNIWHSRPGRSKF
jgi:hypothetical protein